MHFLNFSGSSRKMSDHIMHLTPCFSTSSTRKRASCSQRSPRRQTTNGSSRCASGHSSSMPMWKCDGLPKTSQTSWISSAHTL